jgi:autotransporter-associated beta strand protein
MLGFGGGARGRARPFAVVVAALLAVSVPGASWAQTTWNGTNAGGDWSDNNNWTNNAPTNADTANLTGLGGANQPTLSTGSFANILNMNGNDVAGGNSLNLNGQQLSLGTLNMSAGTISGSGLVTATTAYNLSGGTISAQLGGAAGVTVTGGTVTLSGANTYGGNTNLNSGTLAVGNNGALSDGTLSMADGTTLQSAAAVSLNNAIGLTGTNTIDTNGNATTLSGVLSSGAAVTLNKNGAGTLTLSGANTYSGTTNLNAGTLAAGNNAALGTSTLSMADGTTLQSATANLSMSNNVPFSPMLLLIDRFAVADCSVVPVVMFSVLVPNAPLLPAASVPAFRFVVPL